MDEVMPMWRTLIPGLALLLGGCVTPTYLEMDPDGCTMLKITNNSAVVRDCSAPAQEQDCVVEGFTTYLTHAGEYQTVRCGPQRTGRVAVAAL